VPGRFEIVSDAERDAFSVLVDYAHTPDGLTSVLDTARAVAPPHGRVLVVFGCGGDRDVDKRGLMGAAAVAGADVVVVTSDNPRHEDPTAIVDAIVAGIDPRERDAVMVEIDRRQAIETALAAARPGDVVVVAGKGHETTQTVGDEVRPFDDRAVVREVLREMAGDTGEGGNQ
jgi:UDP-N-acetylmuramoyl-L-alanyl-D-glutamate--2,6-diaminopimelate ligase